MNRSLNALDLGQTALMTRKFTMEDVRRCMEITGDDNRMYWDEAFAGKTRYKRTIVQGLLTEGLVTALINSRIPGPGALLLNKEFVFPNPVFVGESITAKIEVVDVNMERRWVTEKVICTKDDGKEVIRGQIVLFVENVSG